MECLPEIRHYSFLLSHAMLTVHIETLLHKESQNAHFTIKYSTRYSVNMLTLKVFPITIFHLQFFAAHWTLKLFIGKYIAVSSQMSHQLWLWEIWCFTNVTLVGFNISVMIHVYLEFCTIICVLGHSLQLYLKVSFALCFVFSCFSKNFL